MLKFNVGNQINHKIYICIFTLIIYRINNHNGYRIMSVTANPKANAVAITDTLGRATVIRGNLFNYNQIAREVLHWHFLPPLATCFSLQGNFEK